MNIVKIPYTYSVMQLNTPHFIKTLIISISLFTALACSDNQSEEQEQARIGITTLREPFHKSDHVCGEYPSYYLEYLDDTKCRKVLPSNRDRSFTCPINTTPEWLAENPGYAPVEEGAEGNLVVDSEALKNFVDQEAAVTVILIRRVNGVPYYRYLSNGLHDQTRELWSSSKFLGILNASESLRYSSDGQIGLDAMVGEISLGDLVSIVHNYDEKTYTSNGLMYWFHDVGGRHFANQLIHQRWLNRPEAEIYGGNYGARAPDLGFEFSSDAGVVKIKQDQGWIKSNVLSTFTLAEALKRVVMYRENPQTNLEFSTWEDMQVLLYGAQNSQMYDAQTPQGMEGDISVYLQSAVDINAINQNTQGQWRIFSKLGFGYSRGGEVVHTDYGCFPNANENGEIQDNQGVELVISLHQPMNENYVKGDRKVADIYRNIVQAVWRGDLR